MGTARSMRLTAVQARRLAQRLMTPVALRTQFLQLGERSARDGQPAPRRKTWPNWRKRRDSLCGPRNATARWIAGDRASRTIAACRRPDPRRSSSAYAVRGRIRHERVGNATKRRERPAGWR
jgi:hypothetical protein